MQYLNNFLQEKKLRHISELTEKAYVSIITNFFNEVKKIEKEVVPENILAFVIQRQKKLTTRNLKREVRILSDYFDYCLQFNHILVNPIPGRLLKSLRPTHEEREKTLNYQKSRNLAPEKIKQCLNSAHRSGDTFSYLALLLFSETGLRCQECKDLKISNFHFDEGYIEIRGKGGKLRSVPLPKNVSIKVQEFLESKTENQKSEYLFSDSQGKNYSLDKWRKWIENHFPPGVSFHSFRHSLANRMLTEGVPRDIIQMILGHSFPDTLKVYLKPSILQVQKAVENFYNNKK